jgi:hypothetical protein
MEGFLLVLAWLVHVALFWILLIWIDVRQNSPDGSGLNGVGEFLRRLYARARTFAAPQ